MTSIVLVEDNPTICENTAEILEMEGYTVITARNGKEGFQKIKANRPDIIICDVLMPEMNGLDLLAKLGLDSELKTIPFIFYSAKSERKDVQQGMDLGAYDYIVKPSDLGDLLASIQKCIKDKKHS
ncbi:response regulator transcription factor [Maribacter aestuarii]|uniref:response regulator transcription factor n=1 Tax=Maribacter aestuarii TaxID=1130723 RepID=UPI00248CFC7E|nr:response regulator [Maribacter aestuarii]